jgi:putative membrane protein insertion efficiency factor
VKIRSLALICFFILVGSAFQGDEISGLKFILRYNPLAAPISAPDAHSPSFDFFNTETNEVKLLFLSLLKFYQLVISSQDRPSCMFTPTCSEYALLAVQKYGLVAGTIMAADRILRCNGTGEKYYIRDKKTGRLYDPVE